MPSSRPAYLAAATLVLVFIAFAQISLGSESATAVPPAEAFGALPADTDVALSPDGRRLAWVDNTELKAHVEMFDVDARKTLRILALQSR